MPKEHSVTIQAIFSLLAALLLSALLLAPALAAPPSNVTLVYFRAESQESAARLEWRTASEIDTAAFKVERSGSADGPFTPLTAVGIVEARGSADSGDTYEALDDTTSSGQTYWYRLIEIEFSNDEQVLQTAQVTISSQPTAPPVGGGPSDSTSTPLPTSTSPPTSTPRPTDTPVPASPTAGSETNVPASASPVATDTPEPDGNGRSATNTPPPSPTRMNGDSNDGQSQTSGATEIAQATPDPDAYPGPTSGPTIAATATASSYPGSVDPVEPQSEPAESYPGATVGSGNGDLGANGERVVGSGNDANATETESQEDSDGNIGRLLLWVGFAFALLIFIAGVLFAIMLSTRQRHNRLP